MAYDGTLILFAVMAGSTFQLVTGRGTVVYQSLDWWLFSRHLRGVPHDDELLGPRVKVFVGAPPVDVGLVPLLDGVDGELASRTPAARGRSPGHRSTGRRDLVRLAARHRGRMDGTPRW